MKMIARMFCAAALVIGALSLTRCGDKKDAPAKGGTNAGSNAPAAQKPTNA